MPNDTGSSIPLLPGKIPLFKKVMFLGYGAVAKCSWNYFETYFTINPNLVYLVDMAPNVFYGPKLDKIHPDHKIVMSVDATNFESLLNKLGFSDGDIIIDLTFNTPSYFFIKTCFMKGLHYINTSIEDGQDEFGGGSIDQQQQKVIKIYEQCKNDTNIRSCILTECGQNPGLIQHYVLYGLNRLYALANPTDPNKNNEFRREVLTSMIDEYQIGSILMSERDQIKTTRPMHPNVLYNTWCVAGFIAEAFDYAELVHGTMNPYVQPRFPKDDVNQGLMKLYAPFQNQGKEVIFMNESGLHCTLPSIAPVIRNGQLSFEMFRGQLIHHGEIFELANYFGTKAPFMTYVYQSSPFINRSLERVMKNNNYEDHDAIMSHITTKPDSYKVMDNINIPLSERAFGFDSIGATFLCGMNKVNRVFWCGSILSDTDPINPDFTPTVVQVAAGVLSGLSYILEKGRAPGLYQPTDIPTLYMLGKAKPLLGIFACLESNVPFSSAYSYKCVQDEKDKKNPKRCKNTNLKKSSTAHQTRKVRSRISTTHTRRLSSRK
jgi:homospermidine synthase